ncbi:hypothetical protein [Micromonospora sp. SH-82]|uniref:hypothetical protein n=1 Tax=Micromonospora sp. SH-82 TaxID=3132938 RepID=UPI003EB80E57
MTEPELGDDPAERVEPIEARPTANPSRIQVPPEGPGALAGDGEPPDPGPASGEES